MAGVLDAVFGPVIRPSTYWRWVHLILGGAVLVSFMLLAVMVLMSFIPAVRVIEGTAAREFLGDSVPEHASRPATSRESRWRSAGWFVLHLLVGGVVSVLTLALPPTVVVSQLAERNRLAREPHDSVGHALSVVTIQASAAGRVLDTDPESARSALGAIEERRAGESNNPQWTLADLPRLLAKTRIAGVDVESPAHAAPEQQATVAGGSASRFH